MAEDGSQVAALRCREITLSDFEAVTDLLHIGFPNRPPGFFRNMLAYLSTREPCENLPRIGLVLLSDEMPVGVLITISTRLSENHQAYVRCNLACWFVKAPFRMYGPLLMQRLRPRSGVSYVNVSPALHTLPIIEAQGFTRFNGGLLAGIPVLSMRRRRCMVHDLTGKWREFTRLNDGEWQLLRDHQKAGAIAIICRDGTIDYPFVFRRRRVKFIPFPAAQLVYCRALGDVYRHSTEIGRFLASHGILWMLLPSNAVSGGIPGLFFRRKGAMYHRGEAPPRPGDLAYTELALMEL